MSESSAIEWTDATWNPVRGCVKVSPGCANCYAETFAERFRGVPGHPYEQGFDLRLVPEKLDEPRRWKKPRRVFVNSMSDLFQDRVADSFIDQVMAVMANTPRHTYQVLTKRAARMREYSASLLALHPCERSRRILSSMYRNHPAAGLVLNNIDDAHIGGFTWPLPNVWLGVSVENQHFADERIPLLLETPAAVRFISAEPLLGPLDVSRWLRVQGGGAGHCFDIDGEWWHKPGTCNGPICLGQCCGRGLDWVIVGGESGNGARGFDIAWARSIVTQCRAAGVPVFMKQLGASPYEDRYEETKAMPPARLPTSIYLHSRKGGEITEWPEDLQVREFPEARA